MLKIDRLLNYLRKSTTASTYIFKNGGCFMLYKIIKLLYPKAEAYYDQIEGHVYTKVNQKYYDITGECEYNEKWIKLKDEPKLFKDAEKWSCNFNNSFWHVNTLPEDYKDKRLDRPVLVCIKNLDNYHYEIDCRLQGPFNHIDWWMNRNVVAWAEIPDFNNYAKNNEKI